MAGKRMLRAKKKKLKEPDEFITFSSKALAFLLENKSQAIFISISLLLIMIIFTGIRSYYIKSENRAFTILSQSIAEYQAAVKDGRNTSALQKVDEELNAILDQYSAGSAKKFVKVYLANIHFQNKDFDKAVDLYDVALKDFGEDPLINNLILSSLACSYAEKNDYKSALSYFETIVSGGNGFMKDEALFNLGRLYEATGEQDKSRDAFLSLDKNYPDYLYAELIKEKSLHVR